MSAFGLEHTLGLVVCHGALGLANGGWRLEADSEVNVGAVGDATLDAARVVGLGCQSWARYTRWVGSGGCRGDDEGVVVDGAGDLSSTETRANFETLCGWDAEHGVGELGLELVETWLSKTGGAVADDTGDIAADAVLLVPEIGDELRHALGGLGVGAANGEERVDLLAGDLVDQSEEFGVGGGGGVSGSRGEEVLGTDGRCEGDNLNTVGFPQVLFGNGAGSDTTWKGVSE